MLQKSCPSNLDPFNPNDWDELFAQIDAERSHVYLDNDGRVCALIDAIDYQWATQWRWCGKKDPSGAIYARRAVGVNGSGQRLVTYTKYLHVEIMKRTKIRRPSRKHTLVDHRNGNSLDCRRKNLRWATPAMNRRNQWGHAPKDLVED